MGTTNLPYVTLYRLNDDATITRFSTQRKSFKVLKPNEFRTQQDAFRAQQRLLEAKRAFGAVEESDEESQTWYDDEESYAEVEESSLDYIITRQNITIILNDEEHIVSRDFGRFDELYDMIVSHSKGNSIDIRKVEELIDLSKRIKKHTDNMAEVQNGVMYVNGEMIPTTLAQGITSAVLDGNNQVASTLKNFWDKLKQNPSEESRQNLFNFISSAHLGINQNGDVVGYKYVNSNMTDAYTGQTKISLGVPVEMPREEVLADSNIACGPGLHVGNKDYSFDGQKHVIIVTVNPKDAVSCPKDHSFQKLRCCKYTPVALTHDGDLTPYATIIC